MENDFPRWPENNDAVSKVRTFRRDALKAPLAVGDGFDEKATRALFRELLPGPSTPPIKDKDWPWFWRTPAKSDEAIAKRVRRLVGQGADPSFRVQAPQGCFTPLGMAAWLGLEQTVHALLEAGANATWPDGQGPDGDATQDDTQEWMSAYEGIPSDPLAAATQALGVAIESQPVIEAGVLERSARIASKIGEVASPFRADPYLGRNPIEELFVQVDYLGNDFPCPQDVAILLWDWMRDHTEPERLKQITANQTERFHIPNVSDPVPEMLLEPLKVRALEWVMDQEIESPGSASKEKPRSFRF